MLLPKSRIAILHFQILHLINNTFVGAETTNSLSPGLKLNSAKDCKNLRKQSNTCKCSLSSDDNEYEVECPLVDLTIEPLDSLSLSCEGVYDDSSLKRSIVKLEIGFVDSIDIDDCLLARDGTFKDLLSHLGIVKFHELSVVTTDRKLTTLPSLYFGNLIHLRDFSCWMDLKELPADLFSGSSNLLSIDLSINELQTLPESLLVDQVDLQELDLSENFLTTLPDRLFARTKNLQFLQLESNQFTRIPELFFMPATSLERLDHTVKGYASFMTQLHSLTLGSNHITCLSLEKLHSPTTTTLELDLSNNHIQRIDFPSNSSHIQGSITIDLRSNLIDCNCSSIYFFKHLRNVLNRQQQTNVSIKMDDLYCNGPMTLKISKLKELDLSSFMCQRTEPDFCRTPCQCIDKGNNYALIIDCINSNRTEFPDLAKLNPNEFEKIELNMENNYLTAFPSTKPENFDSVAILLLAKNAIANIEAYQLPARLEILDLSYNLLTELPDRLFVQTKLLKKLILSCNRIVKLTNTIFASLKSLESLHLDKNHLKTIEDQAFRETNALRYLYLQDNRLDLQPSNASEKGLHFDSLAKLKVLKLHNNLITRIHPYWMGLKELEELDLSYNQMTSLSSKDLRFSTTKTLKLDLSGNQIRTILLLKPDVDIRVNIILNLNFNPLNCNCSILSFIDYLRQNRQQRLTINAENLYCEHPESFNGSKVSDIEITELYCPRSCRCKERSGYDTFIINCSKANLSALPELCPYNFLKSSKIELDMQDNNISNLSSTGIEVYDNLSKLNLVGNNLKSIDASQLPAKLEILDLRRNHLSALPADVLNLWRAKSSNIKTVFLSKNPWPCSCESIVLLEFIRSNSQRIGDLSELHCVDSSNQYKKFIDLTNSQLCPYETHLAIIISASLALFGITFAVLFVFYHLYSHEIKVWLYARNMCLWFVSEKDLDKNKRYDVFISYSHKDKEFVQEKLTPFLENGPHPFKVCDHERDWLVGGCIPEQIINSVEDSKRTMIILSENYLESVWGRMEFQAAHHLALKERHAKIIIVLYGELKSRDKIDNELKAYLNMNTYLEWGTPWFWKKLLYAMPHSKYTKNMNSSMQLTERCLQQKSKSQNDISVPCASSETSL